MSPNQIKAFERFLDLQLHLGHSEIYRIVRYVQDRGGFAGKKPKKKVSRKTA